MTVAKFGGSSLVGAQGFLRVAAAIEKYNIPIVIVSAPGGKPKVTDLLIAAYDEWLACGRCGGKFDEAMGRFDEVTSAIGIDIGTETASIRAAIDAGAGYDYTVSRGEYLSAKILARILGCNFADARECVKLGMDGKIDFASVKAHFGSVKAPCVIPGFYGKLPSGKIKLLPRGGSDISAAAIAAAAGGELWKFTDVSGIYDGMGGIIDALDYDQAELLCYFGATVLQYECLPIIKKAGVKLTVRSIFEEGSGTEVGERRYCGRAFSSRKMFFGGERASAYKHEILNEGLKIPVSVSFLGKERILIDDCGFSDLALRRIFAGKDIVPVTATAAIGEHGGHPFVTTDAGGIYIDICDK